MINRLSRKAARDAELIGDDITGKIVSKDPLRNSYDNIGNGDPNLRRFIHDQESIYNPQLLGSGKHGVAILGTILDIEYALKVVSAGIPKIP